LERPSSSIISWLAPELLQNTSAISPQADVFSFGTIVWEMVAKQTPWKDYKSYAIEEALSKGEL
jgi:serine/threonine protein kinase